jgi:hypothetical protein
MFFNFPVKTFPEKTSLKKLSLAVVFSGRTPCGKFKLSASF